MKEREIHTVPVKVLLDLTRLRDRLPVWIFGLYRPERVRTARTATARNDKNEKQKARGVQQGGYATGW